MEGLSFKFKVSPEDSLKAQQMLFNKGCVWNMDANDNADLIHFGITVYIYVENGLMSHSGVKYSEERCRLKINVIEFDDLEEFLFSKQNINISGTKTFSVENFNNLKNVCQKIIALSNENVNGDLMNSQLIFLGENIKEFINNPIVKKSDIL